MAEVRRVIGPVLLTPAPLVVFVNGLAGRALIRSVQAVNETGIAEAVSLGIGGVAAGQRWLRLAVAANSTTVFVAGIVVEAGESVVASCGGVAGVTLTASATLYEGA